MMGLLESEPIRAYVLMWLAVVVGAHGIVYLLSLVGLLLRPFWRKPVAFLYPWVYLFKHPGASSRTHLSRSGLLFGHALWLLSSVVLWLVITLSGLVGVLNELFPHVVGLDPFFMWGMRVPAWLGISIQSMYIGAFAALSSWMWLRSLRSSLAHSRRMNDARDGGGLDDARHHVTPFRKATAWASATLPILIGLIVLDVVMFPPFQG